MWRNSFSNAVAVKSTMYLARPHRLFFGLLVGWSFVTLVDVPLFSLDEHFLEISGTYLKHFCDISGIYLGHIWDISWIYWDISGTFLGHI